MKAYYTGEDERTVENILMFVIAFLIYLFAVLTGVVAFVLESLTGIYVGIAGSFYATLPLVAILIMYRYIR